MEKGRKNRGGEKIRKLGRKIGEGEEKMEKGKKLQMSSF